MHQLCETSSAHHGNDNHFSNEEFSFDESLRELKDLRTQLHFAADSCETIFFKCEDKRDIMDNTKEYICRALVTLVDHLGNVSAKLNYFISDPNEFSDVELRIDCIEKKIMSSQQYVQEFAISKLRWRENLPTYQRRYVPTTVTLNEIEKPREDPTRDNVDLTNPTYKKYIYSHKIPRFLYTSASVDEPSPSSKNAFYKDKTIRDELSLLKSKLPYPIFNFQLRRSRSLYRRPSSPTLLGLDILSFINPGKKNNSKI